MKTQRSVPQGKEFFSCYKQFILRDYIIYTMLMIFTFAGTVSAQVHRFTEEQMKDFTASNPYGRFADGRPMIPDEVLDSVRQMQIQVIEAIDVLKAHNYNNQFEGDWKILIPGKKIMGRAFTVQFMPTRPDLEEGMKTAAAKNNSAPVSKANTIDMLQKNDLAVIDLYGKIEGGLPYVGDKLAYYIWKTTGTGMIVNGGIYYLETMARSGMQAFYRGTQIGTSGRADVSGVNIPIRIGDAVIMPGDLVIGDEDGILAIPPQFVSEVIKTTITNRRRDIWIKKAFDMGRYKSSEIYGNIKDPVLAKQFSDYKATGDPKFLPK
jgi:4-hydroxy-4-methyl-2-oxoglutarate aldolase